MCGQVALAGVSTHDPLRAGHDDRNHPSCHRLIVADHGETIIIDRQAESTVADRESPGHREFTTGPGPTLCPHGMGTGGDHGVPGGRVRDQVRRRRDRAGEPPSGVVVGLAPADPLPAAGRLPAVLADRQPVRERPPLQDPGPGQPHPGRAHRAPPAAPARRAALTGPGRSAAPEPGSHRSALRRGPARGVARRPARHLHRDGRGGGPGPALRERRVLHHELGRGDRPFLRRPGPGGRAGCTGAPAAGPPRFAKVPALEGVPAAADRRRDRLAPDDADQPAAAPLAPPGPAQSPQAAGRRR